MSERDAADHVAHQVTDRITRAGLLQLDGDLLCQPDQSDGTDVASKIEAVEDDDVA